MAMASRVPLGIAEVGSFKSPLMLAPATMPVTARESNNKLECLVKGKAFWTRSCGRVSLATYP
jgi:hypothetical protein